MNILTEFPQVYMCGIHRLFKESQRISVGQSMTSNDGKYTIHNHKNRFVYDPLTYIILGKPASKHGIHKDICTWAELNYLEYAAFVEALKGKYLNAKCSTLTMKELDQLIHFSSYINSCICRNHNDAEYYYEISILAQQFPEAHKKLKSVL